jgi:DNA repair protein RadC
MKNINIVRIQVVKEKSMRYETNQILNPEDAVLLLQQFIIDYCNNDRENFIVMCLDTKHKINSLTLTSTGTLNASLIHPREVFKTAILSNAAAILLCHNHPSGNCEPSNEDIEITKRLQEAGKIMGIEILDHIIIGDSFLSMKQKGLI